MDFFPFPDNLVVSSLYQNKKVGIEAKIFRNDQKCGCLENWTLSIRTILTPFSIPVSYLIWSIPKCTPISNFGRNFVEVRQSSQSERILKEISEGTLTVNSFFCDASKLMCKTPHSWQSKYADDRINTKGCNGVLKENLIME